MTTIPLSVGRQERLETGNVVQFPQGGGPIGAALENAGNKLGDLANQMQGDQERLDNFKLRTESQLLDLTLEGDREAAKQNMPADGQGFHDSFVGEYNPDTGQATKPGLMDERIKATRERLPESQRGRFDAMVPAFRKDYSNKTAKDEYDQRQDYYKLETIKTLGILENSILNADPDDKVAYETFKKKGEDLIKEGGLPDIQKLATLEKWQAGASETAWRALLAKDPQRALAALGFAPKPQAEAGSVGDTVVDKIIGHESRNDPNAKNPRSSATGLGQFTNGTWIAMVRKYEPELAQGRSREQLLALRRDPATSRRMTTYYAKENADALGAAGLPVNDTNIYLAHFAGSGGATSVLKAVQAGNGGASVASILGPDAMDANPFLRGMSANDLVAWSAGVMGKKGSTQYSGGVPDPQFQNIPADRRLILVNAAQSDITQQGVSMRSELTSNIQDALTAFQRGDNYDGTEPSREHFLAAYPEDGEQRFEAYEKSKATAKTVASFTTASEADMKSALVAAEAAIPSGEGAFEAQKRLGVMQDAYAQTMKAREKPADYVMQNFPAVAEAWKQYQPGNPGSARHAIAVTTEMQKQIGILPENIQPMPPEMVAMAATAFKDEHQPIAARADAISDLVLSTSDPVQQQAIFRELVKANVPASVEAAIEAAARGDKEASRRLFAAATINPEKYPITKIMEDNKDYIETSINNQLIEPGSKGEAYYGLQYGDPTNIQRAARDMGLMQSAVRIRMSQGEEYTAAVEGATQDLFGDVARMTQWLPSGGKVDAIVPDTTDENAFVTGLNATLPTVRAAVQAQADASIAALTGGGDVPAVTLTSQEQHLIDHHKAVVAAGQAIINADGTHSTVLQRVVEHDGKFYSIPSVWDGKKLSEQESRVRASAKGWDYWPSYDTPDAADARYMNDIHPIFDQVDAKSQSSEQRVIMDAVHSQHVEDIIANGAFRTIGYGDQYGFFDASPGGGWVTGADGKPLIFPLDQVLKMGTQAPRPRGTGEQLFGRPQETQPPPPPPIASTFPGRLYADPQPNISRKDRAKELQNKMNNLIGEPSRSNQARDDLARKLGERMNKTFGNP